MKKKISVAIIGCGVVGKRRKKFIEKNNNYSLIAISDIRFKKKNFPKIRFNIINIIQTYWLKKIWMLFL